LTAGLPDRVVGEFGLITRRRTLNLQYIEKSSLLIFSNYSADQ
jgi:hypothetical protein